MEQVESRKGGVLGWAPIRLRWALFRTFSMSSGSQRDSYSVRGRGTYRGRGLWRERGEDSYSSTIPGQTRPYRRSSSGRGSVQSRKRTNSGRERAAGAEREKTGASQQVLARAAAIKESASQFARDGCEYSSDGSSDDEEKAEGREMIKSMLKIYYQDLGDDDGIIALVYIC